MAHEDNIFDLRAEFRPAGTSRSESARITEGGQSEAKPGTPTGKGKRAQEFIAAFNKGDAKAVAAFWMPDATYVDQTGRQTKGQAAIEKLYAKVFADQKAAKLTIHVTSMKLLSPDVALEEGITEVTPGMMAALAAANRVRSMADPGQEGRRVVLRERPRVGPAPALQCRAFRRPRMADRGLDGRGHEGRVGHGLVRLGGEPVFYRLHVRHDPEWRPGHRRHAMDRLGRD